MPVPIALCKGKKKEKNHLCPEFGIVFRFHMSVWLEHEVSEVKNKCFPLVFSSETGSCLRHSRNLKPYSKFDFGDHFRLLEDSVADVGLMLTWCNTENRTARKGYRKKEERTKIY